MKKQPLFLDTFEEAVNLSINHLRLERLLHSNVYRESCKKGHCKEFSAMWDKFNSPDFASVAGPDDIHCCGAVWSTYKEMHILFNGPTLEKSAGAVVLKSRRDCWGFEPFCAAHERNICVSRWKFLKSRIADMVIPTMPMNDYLEWLSLPENSQYNSHSLTNLN